MMLSVLSWTAVELSKAMRDGRNLF